MQREEFLDKVHATAIEAMEKPVVRLTFPEMVFLCSVSLKEVMEAAPELVTHLYKKLGVSSLDELSTSFAKVLETPTEFDPNYVKLVESLVGNMVSLAAKMLKDYPQGTLDRFGATLQ